jgi:hypothetical protein
MRTLFLLAAALTVGGSMLHHVALENRQASRP